MLTRTTRMLCTAALALTFIVGLGTSDALAAGSCSASARLPARVAIDRSDVLVTAPVVTNCSNYLASAYLNGPSGSLDYLVYDDTTPTQTIDFYASFDKIGAYSTVFDTGYSAGGAGGVTWTSSSITYKYATWSYIASSRAGTAVYINTLIHQYSNSYNGMASGVGRVSYLQRYIGGTWQNVIARTGNSTGRWTVGFIQPKVYQYRIVTVETGTAWSASSASTFR
jgi:hypothetical protein